MSKYNGILLVNKPSGITSFDVILKLKKIFKTKEIGHAGTLDPLASGLLVILMGEATKLSDYALNADKSYIARVRLGESYDTLDVTGKLTSQMPVNVSEQDLIHAVTSLTGIFSFSIPLYSAAKVEGKKLYEYARLNQEIVPPKKEMKFFNIQILNHDLKSDKKWVEVAISCSKGSFIRTWADELGKKLGCGASIETLQRTASDPYELSQSLGLTYLESLQQDEPRLMKTLIDLNTVIQKFSYLTLNLELEGRVRNGLIPHLLMPQISEELKTAEVIALRSDIGHLVALAGTKTNGKVGLLRVFKDLSAI